MIQRRKVNWLQRWFNIAESIPMASYSLKLTKLALVVRTNNILITDDIIIIIKFRDGSGMSIRMLPSEHGMRAARSSHQSSLEDWANNDFWSQLQVPLSCLKEQKQWNSGVPGLVRSNTFANVFVGPLHAPFNDWKLKTNMLHMLKKIHQQSLKGIAKKILKVTLELQNPRMARTRLASSATDRGLNMTVFFVEARQIK